VRIILKQILSDDTPVADVLKDDTTLKKVALFQLKHIKTHLPMKIGACTDFFAGKNHAFNCGVIFRDPKNALQPNYLHLPVGYSSRALSVVPSGTSIYPQVERIPEDLLAKKPILALCRRLDIELELGALMCKFEQDERADTHGRGRGFHLRASCC
jgi:fumarylacetoacetase